LEPPPPAVRQALEWRRVKIGLITIGQSPREDLLEEIREGVGEKAELLEAGALDGLDREEIDALRPAEGEHHLITRLRDGSSTIVGKERIIPKIQAKIQELEEKGVDITVLLCTGEFPEFKTRKPLLQPDKILKHVITAVAEGKKLGVIVPIPEQLPYAEKKWAPTGCRVYAVSASPYHEKESVEEAARSIKLRNVDLVLLDCMGFGAGLKKRVAEITGRPVIQSLSLVAKIAGELSQ
jgi:protein AroM